MSNFEKEFNSYGMKKYRWPITFAILILIGFLGYHFEKVTIAIVAAVIVLVIVLVEMQMSKR